MRNLIVICFLALIAACATQTDIDSWIGSSYDDLILTYGVPVAEASLSNGNRMIEFHHSRFIQSNEYECTLRFLVDPDDFVVRGDSRGNIGGCNQLIEARN